MGLLFAATRGSRPFKEPEAQKRVPSGIVCTDAYHRAEANLLPGSVQLWPFWLPSAGLLRYRIPSKPSPTVGSRSARGPLPPSETTLPSARNDPPEQKALVSTERGTYVLV